ncbi:hypothetical protein CC2G_014448 [Coprinopsis cinerea AmutBmut pab1-1]|nr:hypothetical protein CC2G_014448 [Coprinopsis cinerea AmutBmut pab1-1]
MGRHRKYHTPEERKAANRKKAKAYYYRHHTEICLSRRKTSANVPEQSSSAPSSSKPPPGGPSHGPYSKEYGNKSDKFNDPAYWVQRALKQKDSVAKLIEHQTIPSFLKDLCTDLAKPDATQCGAKACLEDYLNGLSAIRKRVDTCHGYVLDLVGVGPDLKTVAKVYREVDAVVRPLEEIEVQQEGWDIIAERVQKQHHVN